MSERQVNSYNLYLVTGFVALSLVLAGCTPQAMQQTEEGTPAATTETTTETTSETTQQVPVETMAEKLWEKTATGYATTVRYDTPDGTDEQVTFNVSVGADGTVAGVTVQGYDPKPISTKQQASFRENIDAIVVGKQISEIEKVDRVGTSSLTSGAFFKAVEELKMEMAS